MEIFVGFYANTDTSCIDYLHYLRKKYVPMHKHTQIRLNVALQCPYYDNVSFKYGKKKKRISAPELITITLPVTKQKRKATNVIKKHTQIFFVSPTPL